MNNIYSVGFVSKPAHDVSRISKRRYVVAPCEETAILIYEDRHRRPYDTRAVYVKEIANALLDVRGQNTVLDMFKQSMLIGILHYDRRRSPCKWVLTCGGEALTYDEGMQLIKLGSTNEDAPNGR